MTAPCQTNSSRPHRAGGRSSARRLCRASSLAFSFELVQEPSNPIELLGRRSPRRKGLHDQSPGRAAEGSVDEIPHELPLRLFLSRSRLVDVGTLRLVPRDESFLR